MVCPDNIQLTKNNNFCIVMLCATCPDLITVMHIVQTDSVKYFIKSSVGSLPNISSIILTFLVYASPIWDVAVT